MMETANGNVNITGDRLVKMVRNKYELLCYYRDREIFLMNERNYIYGFIILYPIPDVVRLDDKMIVIKTAITDHITNNILSELGYSIYADDPFLIDYLMRKSAINRNIDISSKIRDLEIAFKYTTLKIYMVEHRIHDAIPDYIDKSKLIIITLEDIIRILDDRNPGILLGG